MGIVEKALIVGFLIMMINDRKMDLNSYDKKVWKIIVKFYRESIELVT